MKMGIKEFRERLGEIAGGDEMVVVTHHGRRVGRYIPERAAAVEDVDLDAWLRARQDFSRRWRASTPDWREQLRSLGEPEEDIEAAEADDRCC